MERRPPQPIPRPRTRYARCPATRRRAQSCPTVASTTASAAPQGVVHTDSEHSPHRGECKPADDVTLTITWSDSRATCRSYGTALMLMTAYGAVIGDMATPVGPAPEHHRDGHGSTRRARRPASRASSGTGGGVGHRRVHLDRIPSISVGSGGPASGRFPADEIIADRWRALVPWRAGERNVVIAFGVTVSLWIGPDLLPLFL